MLLGVDADRERPDHRHLAAAGDLEAFVIDLGLEGAVHGVEKVLAVVAEMEAEQIVAQ